MGSPPGFDHPAVAALRDSGIADEYRNFVSGLTEDELTYRPASGEWSILEILHHLGDAEVVRLTRIEHLLTEDNPRLTPLPPLTPVPDTSTDFLIAKWESGRSAVLARVSTLSAEELARPGDHPKTGLSSVEDQVQKCETHARNHLDQCRANLKALHG